MRVKRDHFVLGIDTRGNCDFDSDEPQRSISLFCRMFNHFSYKIE
jgi:hypothetical protein